MAAAEHRAWTLQEAERNAGEVIRLALDEGPQRILDDGQEVVIMNADTWDAIVAGHLGQVSDEVSGPE